VNRKISRTDQPEARPSAGLRPVLGRRAFADALGRLLADQVLAEITGIQPKKRQCALGRLRALRRGSQRCRIEESWSARRTGSRQSGSVNGVALWTRDPATQHRLRWRPTRCPIRIPSGTRSTPRSVEAVAAGTRHYPRTLMAAMVRSCERGFARRADRNCRRSRALVRDLRDHRHAAGSTPSTLGSGFSARDNAPRRQWLSPRHNLTLDWIAVTGLRPRAMPLKRPPRAVLGTFLRDCHVTAHTSVVARRMNTETEVLGSLRQPMRTTA
jgi:hypothetical protein